MRGNMHIDFVRESCAAFLVPALRESCGVSSAHASAASDSTPGHFRLRLDQRGAAVEVAVNTETETYTYTQ